MKLSEEAIDIWWIDLEEKSNLSQLWLYLSAEEQQRAPRFKFDRHRDRFVMARGNLRVILSQYLEGIAPADIQFVYTDRGKPILANSHCLQFNLSHAHQHAIYAISLTPVGIDLEYPRSLPDLLSLAQRFFTPEEYQILSTLSSSDQQQLFFQIWTLKEAYLKATGEGLTKLAAAQTKWEQNVLMGLILPPDQSHWISHQFQPCSNYIAAVVGTKDKLCFR